jgi:hypothetical protein
METVDSRPSTTPTILGIIGGVAMAIGSFLTWATVSVNFDRIAEAVGLDPSQIPAEIRAQGTVSVTGWEGNDGKWTLVAGVIVAVAAGLLVMASSRRVVAIVMIVGGAVGGGLALYDATLQKDNVIDDVSGTFAGIGLPGSLADYFSLSLGIGIWLCIAGGVLAVIAGIMAMLAPSPALDAGAQATSGFIPPPPLEPLAPDAGFGIADVGGSLAPTEGMGSTPSVAEAPEPVASNVEPDGGSGTGVPGPDDSSPTP